jgi:hypothetical protein
VRNGGLQRLEWRRSPSFTLLGEHQGIGLDQAVHNYVLHEERVPGARLPPNGAGVVSTLGIVPEARVGKLLSAPILHQYDRHRDLAAALLKRVASDDEALQPSPGDAG